MLDMKPRCERCDGILRDDELAYICSYECTFCANCAKWFQAKCPNCNEELVKRPRRGVEVVVGSGSLSRA